jgi:P27 family predicted phage terminase small subunit
MPGHLRGEAKAEWRRVVPQLEEIGVLATIDRAVLIRYCTAWAEWLEMDSLLRKSGKVIRGQKGNLVRSPLLLVRSELEQTLSDLGRQLGLSPVARLRAGITHEKYEVEDDSATIAAIEDYRRQLGVSLRPPQPCRLNTSTSISCVPIRPTRVGSPIGNSSPLPGRCGSTASSSR